jgi:putative aldouronate transport system permease protein
MIYTSSPSLQTIQYYLKKVITDPSASTSLGTQAAQQLPEMARRVTPQTIKLAAMMVTALPVTIIYPFLQRYFVKGVMIGSVKG